VQQLSRAVDIFKPILRHLLSLTFAGEWKIQSMAREDGMIIVKNASKQFVKTQKWSRFPYGLTSTPDIAEAVLMYSQCNAPLGSARSLVEMLIRRKCPNARFATNRFTHLFAHAPSPHHPFTSP
jgi:hypothetical protein